MPLPKKYRLVSKSDFDKVFRDGQAVKGSFLFIKSRINGSSSPRFGFIVPKKIYSKAVDRNRLKRVLAEIVASYLKKSTSNGRNFVIVINKQGEEGLIKDELINLLR
ncbi:MAG: ribonuclease P protein component [bacterium]|nr:ribonuclease P protein component [bacterium]